MRYSFTMANYNALSLLLFKHDQNRVWNHNLYLIQELMSYDTLARVKFKRQCADFPNISILIKSDTPGKVQVTLCHVNIWNKTLGKLSPMLTLQDHPNHQYLLPFTPSMPSPVPATRYAYWSWRFSFDTPLATLLSQTSSKTMWHWTPYYSCNS